jgi:Domain of unknown function (DUF397)
MLAFDLSRAVWRESHHSGQNGNCVEVAAVGPAVAVRDSKDPAGPALAFRPATWVSFTTRVKADN